MNEKAQGSQLLLLMVFMFLLLFIFSDTAIRFTIAVSLDAVFAPLIGFNGQYPLLTIFLAGIIVVFLSSFFTNLFTDWKAMGKAQETSRAFQKELNKARREGNTNRVNKLMKMQPQIMQMTTQSSGGMFKPMFFLFLFIAPIFMWLTFFLGNLPYFYFTVPWGQGVSLFDRSISIMSNWFLLYLVFSMVVGQVIRQGLKYLTWTERWQNFSKNIKIPFK